MEDYLYCKDLFDPVLGHVAKSSDMSDDKWTVMHRKTISNGLDKVSFNTLLIAPKLIYCEKSLRACMNGRPI